MKFFVTAAVSVAVLVLTAEVAMAQQSLDQPSSLEIIPAPTESPPVIDGVLDDECWESAAAVGGFKLNTGRGPARCRTTVRVSFDADSLYVAFRCEEPETDKLTVEYKKDDSPVWRDDCVEVFISPQAVASSENLHHFVVNCLGKKAYLFGEHLEAGRDWEAAASVSERAWFAEIAIPFEILRPVGTNDPYWRVNFCRVDLVHGEESSWSEVPGRFAGFWRFGKLKAPEGGPRFTQFRGKPRPLKPEGTPAAARTITDIPDEPRPLPAIIPEPRVAKIRPGAFTITPETRIVVGKSDDPMDMRPAEEINEELERVAGFTLKVQEIEGVADFRGCIIVGERRLNPAAEDYCRSNGIRVSREFPGREGYVLEVGKDGVLVSGCDQAGTFWGAQTLRQLIAADLAGRRVSVPCVSIRDWPRFAYRGVHLLATTDGLSFHGRMIEKVFSRFKINNIVLQCEYVEWESHPEIRNPRLAVRKDDIRRLIKTANNHHITVTPLLQSLGHLGWAFYNNANLDMAEDPEAKYAYCPLSPKSHEFMADLIDETIELFGRPEYVHMGRDEFDMRGRFPVHEECKRIGKERLYIDDTIWIYNYLKSKGAKTMMWGDVLLMKEYEDKIRQLPRDIVICDWHYGPNETYPSLDFFEQNGFTVIGCTWYNPKNLYHFSADAYKRRIAGMMQTTWTGFWTEDVVLEQEFRQIHSYILGAAWAWSPGTPALDELPYESEQVFSGLWSGTPSKADRSWFAVKLAPFCNISLVDTKKRIGWLGLGPGNDLSGLPKGVAVLAGVPFDLGVGRTAIIGGGPADLLSGFGRGVAGIPVARKADKLHFLHTAAFFDKENKKVGEYVIRYSDGSAARVHLTYGETISAWNASTPAARVRTAWRGKTASGDAITLHALTWTNPNPDKQIVSLDFVVTDSQAAPVLLAVTGEHGEE